MKVNENIGEGQRTQLIERDAGDTFKEPSFVSIMAMCCTENVESWAQINSQHSNNKKNTKYVGNFNYFHQQG